MDRAAPKETRTFAQAEDTKDLEAVISAALSASPVDIIALRRGVWTYVGEERHAGTSPGWVILELTKLIDGSVRGPSTERADLTKQVILWCVEAYFGQLGGEAMWKAAESGRASR